MKLSLLQIRFESAASKYPSLAATPLDFSKTPEGRCRDRKAAALFALWMDAYSFAKDESSSAIDRALAS